MLVSSKRFSFSFLVSSHLADVGFLQMSITLLRARSRMVLVVGERMGSFRALWRRSTRRTRW